VQDFNERLSEVDAKISQAKCSGGNQSEELKEARSTMKSLRERKDAIMRDRAEIATLQKSAKSSLDSKITVCVKKQVLSYLVEIAFRRDGHFVRSSNIPHQRTSRKRLHP